jgi:nucleotide-binding universal stress UspA family protein
MPNIDPTPAPSHLVVASDFSACADNAMRRANAVAVARGAKLSLLHVVEPLPVVSAWGDPGMAAWIGLEALQDAGRERLKQQRARLSGDVTAEVALHCRIGQPRRDLGALAAELGGELLVLGTHAPDGLGQRLLGSTAQAAVHACPLPLLVCRRPATAPWRRVLGASDFSPSAERALLWARVLAPEAEKHLVHVHASLPEATLALVQPDPAALERFTAEAEKAALGRFDALAARYPDWIAHFRRGDVAGTVEQEAAGRGVDLVVMGTRGHGPWLGGLLGSVGQRLLARLDADVLLVPQPA